MSTNKHLRKAVLIDTATQLLEEITEEYPGIELVKYNSHLGVWELHFKDAEDMEFEDFKALFEWLTSEDVDPDEDGYIELGKNFA